MAYKYLNSTSIKVYPTANRGKGAELVDEESMYTSETNITNIGGTLGFVNKSFVYQKDNDLVIVINGYRFEMEATTVQSLYANPVVGTSKIYASIYLKYGDSINETFKQLVSGVSGTVGGVLDSDNEFKGLAFSDTVPNDGSIYILVYEYVSGVSGNIWKIPETSKLVMTTEQITQTEGGVVSDVPISEVFTTETINVDEVNATSVNASEAVNSNEINAGGVYVGNNDVVLTSSGIESKGTIEAPSIKTPAPSGNFASCTTSPGSVYKEITLLDFPSSNISDGTHIYVHFRYSNTAVNPVLRINGTTDIPLYRNQREVVGTTIATSWSSQQIVEIVIRSEDSSNKAVVLNSVSHAETANTLSVNAGSSSVPVYFNNGVPVACSYFTPVPYVVNTTEYSSAGTYYDIIDILAKYLIVYVEFSNASPYNGRVKSYIVPETFMLEDGSHPIGEFDRGADGGQTAGFLAYLWHTTSGTMALQLVAISHCKIIRIEAFI